jgi:peptidoglycan hydrolase CwlO-like protein
MKIRVLQLTVVMCIAAVAVSQSARPTALAARVKSNKSSSLRQSFVAKDKEIHDLKQQIVLLEANITSLNRKVEQLTRKPDADHVGAKPKADIEPVVIAGVSRRGLRMPTFSAARCGWSA